MQKKSQHHTFDHGDYQVRLSQNQFLKWNYLVTDKNSYRPLAEAFGLSDQFFARREAIAAINQLKSHV